MASPNKIRYIEFRIVDIDDNPVTNRALTSTTPGQRVLVFLTRDTVACTDPVTLVNWGSGRYYATYTPTAVGHDYLEIFDELYDLRFIDSEDISLAFGEGTSEQISNIVLVNQDYTASGRFKITEPNPQRFNLLVFNSFDWQSGRVDPSYAIVATAIDFNGNWVTPAFTLLPGTYHFVIIDRVTGEVKVIAPFLKIVTGTGVTPPFQTPPPGLVLLSITELPDGVRTVFTINMSVTVLVVFLDGNKINSTDLNFAPGMTFTLSNAPAAGAHLEAFGA